MNWSLLSVIYYSSLFTAKGLNLYQVLAPNSFSYVDGYISAINRNVHSLVYERVCWSLFRLTRLLRFKKKNIKIELFKTGYKSHYNIPRDLFRCGGSRLEVFSRDVCFVFLDQYIFRKKKKFRSLFILYICFYYLLHRVWHSLNGMMDLWRMCMSIQRCFLIIRFVDAFVTLPLVFFFRYFCYA